MKRFSLLILILTCVFVGLMACTPETPPTNPTTTTTSGQQSQPQNPSATTTTTTADSQPDQPQNPGTTTTTTTAGTQPDQPQTPTSFTITWKDENGNTLTTTTVEKGVTPPSYLYTKDDTVEWDYTVLGWSTTPGGDVLASLPAADESATYYAKVKREKRTYTITFVTNGGTAVSSITQEYGSTVSIPEKPKKDGFRFVSWCSDSALENKIEWPLTVTGALTCYAQWNEQIDIAGYLTDLLNNHRLNPYSYIPDSMLHTNTAHRIPSAVTPDYTSGVSVKDLPSGGFGEQWQMVLENLSESQIFFNALDVIESLTTSSIVAFNNYLDENPGDTAHHNFMSGIYSVTVDFNGETIVYVLDYTATFPVIGEQTAQIYMQMDITSKEKTVRIQLGDANALTYTVKKDSYEFAIKYLGVRRAFFSIERDESGSVTGHISEHLVVKGVGIHSAADFYISDDYVSVVGSKADGMLGATGYIDEVYSTDTGVLLGYEVKESFMDLLTFNTLWFPLDVVDGINSIRYKEAVDKEGTAEDEAAAFFINGSNTPWTYTKVSMFNQSRRYDIEFRTQYFYVYNAEEDTYTVVSVLIPMLFVQEDHMGTLSSDIKKANGINVTLTAKDEDIEKIQSDYATLVEIFAKNKDIYTEDTIVAYIGEKYTFS